MVVGIGLNVNQTVFKSNAPNPVSMKMVTDMDYILDEILQKLLRSIFVRYSHARLESIRKFENDYQRVLYRLLEWHNYLVKGTKVFSRITGTTAYGQLVLQYESGETQVLDMKEVQFII